MACDKSFSSGYMLLSPEKVGVVDLFRILIHSDVGNRKFIDSSGETEESFQRRWIMFLSVLAQKLLLLVAKPLSGIGWAIEFWLNLLSSNQNLGGLLVNCLRGKPVIPHKESESFISFIGNLDKRVELDTRISPGEKEYYADLSMMASKASYENEAYLRTTVTQHWQMEFLGFYDFWNDYLQKTTTQAFMLRDRDTIVVAFRGTEPFNADDWCSDIDLSWYELRHIGKIHGGFMKALGLQRNEGWPKESPETKPLAYYEVRKKLKSLLGENDKVKYVLTGHSLGGALAILFPAILAMHGETGLMERLEGVYTFGQPRVGDDKFGKYMEGVLEERKIKYFRFVYGYDIVPRLPYDNRAFMFKHFGKCCHFNRKYEGKIVEEEPNKNYLSPLHVIPMMMDAWHELKRSFTIHREIGPGYKEGLLLRFFRVIGLLIPGIPAHSPRDYVNAMRLGVPKLFRHQQ
ncbi:triacylglycerol lipase OBL1 [Eucalyptus grandis]|uniref:triacylglycerol lipase OBL1 n=1 Tax=Eucalyptus grandis TaxID=71139 RepID=UPI00192E95BC|nr:triacylglycerol lipase OBL1 [Eucalyptus grandis]